MAEAVSLALRAHYFSTACAHMKHELCKLACKYCGAPCRCVCHRSAPVEESSAPVHYDPDEVVPL
jgi:hypothetical protein